MEDKLYEGLFVVRQPIFDRQGDIWGYELFCREGEGAPQRALADSESAVMRTAASVFLCQENQSSCRPLLMLRFTPESIMDEVPYALPPENTVVLVDASGNPSPGLAEALDSLRKEGYSIGLEGGTAGPETFLSLANVVAQDVGVAGSRKDGLAGNDGPLAMARRVVSLEDYDKARTHGFDLFQGDFFKEPETVEGRKLSSGAVTRLRLFHLLEAKDPDFEETARVIQADVSLSWRLLKLLNSASFGFSQKITSIRQALVLAGWKQIKNWLRVVILTDLKPPEKTSELPLLSVQRGKFLELAAAGVPSAPSPDKLFLLGLFSLLDVMLSVDMAKVASHLPLEEDIKAALCSGEGPLSPWLDSAEAFEAGEWDRLDQALRKIGLEPEPAAAAYYEALSWANRLFSGGV